MLELLSVQEKGWTCSGIWTINGNDVGSQNADLPFHAEVTFRRDYLKLIVL